eukprot:7395799-Pyramimonas_sp.AAC.1
MDLGRQDATIRLIRGVEIPGMVIWHGSGSANGCLPMGASLNETMLAKTIGEELGTWREGALQRR